MKDSRGYFYEAFNNGVFEKNTGIKVNFLQDNQSKSSKGTLRGLHFQREAAAQSKLVRVVKGSAYDVAVDLRPKSPTFGEWFGLELSEENNLQFFIPKGFAHAFLALEDNTIFQYKVDNYYSPVAESGIVWDDKDLGITWPNVEINVNEKDKCLPQLNQLNLKTLW
jgi:dTDP-4-dehydrorhamnose 3,5-epimerase